MTEIVKAGNQHHDDEPDEIAEIATRLAKEAGF